MIIIRPVKNSLNSAAFFDRDGIINEEVGYCHKIEDFIFVPGVLDVMRFLQKKYNHLIIITNQAGIAKGMYTESEYNNLTTWMLSKLKAEGISISKVYYCPHHPQGISPYNIDCTCRKPNIGMILQAFSDFNIDPKTSILLGDKLTDIEAAKKACLSKAILMGTGHSLSDIDILKADKYYSNMKDLLSSLCDEC